MKISIVTPNYNYAHFIGQTIESVVNQDYDNVEHIIVDDGSTDNSIEIIKSYQQRYPKKIKLIQQENRGQTAAINVGLKSAVGDIVGWINSDDYYCDNIFNIIVNKFNQEPSLEVIFGDVKIVDMDGHFIYQKRHLSYYFLECCFSGFANCFTSNTVFWRRYISEKNGLLKENLVCNMDGEYFSRIFIGRNIKFIEKPIACFRKQPNTITALRYKNWDEIVKKEIKIELENSYDRLRISKYIPYKYSMLFRFYFRLRRIFRRILKFHYLYEFIEKKKYYKTHSNSY